MLLKRKLLIILFIFYLFPLLAQSDLERYNEAVTAFFEHDYNRAQKLFQQLGNSFQRQAKEYINAISMELDDRIIENIISSKTPIKNGTLPFIARYYYRKGDYASAVSIYRVMGEENYLVDYALFFTAKTYEKWGNEKEAIRRYESIIKLYEKSVYSDASHYELAIREKNIKTRSAMMQLLIETTNYSNVKNEALKQLANIYIHQGAASKLEDLISKMNSVNNRQLLLYNSAIIQQKKSPQKAILLTQKVIALDPRSSIAEKALYACARYMVEINRIDEALRVLEGYPYEGILVIERGSLLLSLYRRNGNIKAMKVLAEQLLNNKVIDNLSPKDRSYLYLQKGFALQAMGDTPGAMSDYTTVIKSNPLSGISFEASYRIGLIYAKRGEDIRALEYFKELSQKQNLSRQESEALLFAQSITAYGSAQWSKAIELSKQLVATGRKQETGPLRLLAAAYSRDGQYLNAADRFAEVAKIDRLLYNDAIYLSAINYYRGGNYSLAIKNFKNLDSRNDNKENSVATLFWLARSYEMDNQWAMASIVYEKLLAVAIPINNKDPLRSIPDRGELLYAATIAHHRSKNDNAKARHDELRRNYPILHNQLASDLAELEFEKGNYHTAATIYRQAASTTKNPSTLYREALSLELSGNKNRAIDIYVDYIQKEENSQAQLVASRRIAKIASLPKLHSLLASKESISDNPILRAPLILAYVEQAPFYQQDYALRLIATLEHSLVDSLELSNLNLAKGQLLITSKRYTEALTTYSHALNMALSPLQYRLAREKRSEIYVVMKEYSQAVNELFMIYQSYSDNEQLASSSLYKAYILCKEYNYENQAINIANRIKSLYPKSDASKNIINNAI